MRERAARIAEHRLRQPLRELYRKHVKALGRTSRAMYLQESLDYADARARVIARGIWLE